VKKWTTSSTGALHREQAGGGGDVEALLPDLEREDVVKGREGHIHSSGRERDHAEATPDEVPGEFRELCLHLGRGGGDRITAGCRRGLT
jgi:hypothetical protein